MTESITLKQLANLLGVSAYACGSHLLRRITKGDEAPDGSAPCRVMHMPALVLRGSTADV